MRGGLVRHLRRTYGTMIALVLFSVAFVIATFAFAAQLGRLGEQTQGDLSVYTSRAEREGAIVGRAQVERIVSGTSHPGWELNVVTSRARYGVQWSPGPVVTNLPRYPDALSAVLLGTHIPARTIVNSVLFTLYPISSVERIAARTFGIGLVAALLACVLGFFLAERMALKTLRPLLTLRQALQTMAEGGPAPRSLPEIGGEELRDLIATYNRAIDAACDAQNERDAAEQRTHQFIADAGHQLRTPLTVLSGFISILRKGQLRHPDDGPKILQKMDHQIAILRKLVERLMLLESWESAEQPMCELTDIGKFVCAIIDPMAASHPEISLKATCAEGATSCIDRSELTHAITNIVANAIKYAPDGTITVEVAADEKYVSISVADEGPGIDNETLPHVFERFYRGSRRDVPGSGLGLAIAKGVVERAHGTLTVESQPGSGARFTITLPRAVSPSRSAAAVV